MSLKSIEFLVSVYAKASFEFQGNIIYRQSATIAIILLLLRGSHNLMHVLKK
jgi:hypothetical protein